MTALYAVVLLLATTGLAYELALGAVESLLLGQPISQFALIIGLYMAALGVGALVSGWVSRLDVRFVDSAIGTSLVGGVSVPALYMVFGLGGPVRLVLYGLTAVIGILVGMQLPMLMRILRLREGFADVVARSFAVDYAGSLAGSLAFSLVLMPWLGLVRTTLVLGLLNLGAVVVIVRALRPTHACTRGRWIAAALVAALHAALLTQAARIELFTDRT